MKSKANFTSITGTKSTSYTSEEANRVFLSKNETLLSKVIAHSLHNWVGTNCNKYFFGENAENYTIELSIVNVKDLPKINLRYLNGVEKAVQVCEKVGDENQNVFYLRRKTIPKIKK